MSEKRTKLIRAAFEKRGGFLPIQRDTPGYKHFWRKFKKSLKKNR